MRKTLEGYKIPTVNSLKKILDIINVIFDDLSTLEADITARFTKRIQEDIEALKVQKPSRIGAEDLNRISIRIDEISQKLDKLIDSVNTVVAQQSLFKKQISDLTVLLRKMTPT